MSTTELERERTRAVLDVGALGLDGSGVANWS